MTQNAVTAYPVADHVAGTWRIYARRPGMAPLEVTYVRGIPTQYGAWTMEDPFGPKTASLTFPKIGIWDSVGAGDLEWLTYGTDFDIVWDGSVPTGYPGGGFAWEGYAVSFDYSTSSGLTVALQGAMYQLDNYLAKPEYVQRPLPYEWAISNQWRDRPDLRLKPVRVEFPSWWDTTYTAPVKTTRVWEIPSHVRPGQQWTGLTTRQTGSWEPALTSYINTLLTSMYTAKGRWALDLDRFRTPVLRHRDTTLTPKLTSSIDELWIDPATPGVEISLNVDWSQSLNVAYGQGTSLSGEGYTGQVITHDGSRTTYDPLAYLRQVHPIDDDNGWLDPTRMRKEVSLKLQAGLTLSQAKDVGKAHLQRFTDPGITGSVTLTVDPYYNNDYMPRALIKAGMDIHIPRLFGRPQGVVLHVTSVSTDLKAQTTTLSVDSKFRDALTVDEVKLRGRDALAVTRQLIGGQYNPSVPDLLLPWNYAEGSGYIPSGPDFNSRRMFEGMPEDVQFPWTEWTTTHPPSNASWRNCYIKIGPKNASANENWSFVGRREGGVAGKYAFPIKMAQAGTVRMVQLAAYDADGNLMPVKFHFSIYSSKGANVQAMPEITRADLSSSDGYLEGQRYPFFAGAWERYRLDGTRIQTDKPLANAGAGLQQAWGNRAVPAGYWPGSAVATGSMPTGMLVDERQWEFSTTDSNGLAFSIYTPQQSSPDAGLMYGMIYCDQQGTQDVYFMGRIFRLEPGTSV